MGAALACEVGSLKLFVIHVHVPMRPWLPLFWHIPVQLGSPLTAYGDGQA